jgi:hypothetical protein
MNYSGFLSSGTTKTGTVDQFFGLLQLLIREAPKKSGRTARIDDRGIVALLLLLPNRLVQPSRSDLSVDLAESGGG